MNIRRRLFGAMLALLCLVAEAADLQAGRDFRLINPPLVADAGRVEVTEFFWYGCPHCFDFEPVLAPWAARLPADVVFRRVPAVFPNDKWTPGARLYYTLEALNLADALHGEVFKAIHVERKRIDEERHLMDWVAGKGIDPAKFREAWSSFGVASRVRQARELTLASGITGVPAMVVHGRYQAITPGNYGDLIALVDQLVARVRAEAIRR